VLIPVTCALAASCIISGFSIVPWALLTRGTDFRTQTWINTSSAVVSGAIGIWLAYAGKGVWSLVAQRLISSGMSMLLLLGCVGRLRGRFRWQSLREIWAFSSSLLASNLLTTVVENAYNVVIGRCYQPADLGQYNRAMTLAHVPSATLGHIVVRVSVPVLSRLQDDLHAAKVQGRRYARLLALVAFPVMVAMAVLAKPLVLVLLTDKWLPAVPYLQILSFALLSYPITLLLLNGLVALGRSGVLLGAEVLKRVMQILILAATFRSGVIGIVWGMLALSVVGFLISGACARSYLGYRWREQAQDLVPALAVCLVMAAGMLLAGRASEGCEVLTQLCLQALVGGGLYCVFVFAGRHGWFSSVFDDLRVVARRLKDGRS
jgi:O-antigen/teichoic acid export membrane protein